MHASLTDSCRQLVREDHFSAAVLLLLLRLLFPQVPDQCLVPHRQRGGQADFQGKALHIILRCYACCNCNKVRHRHTAPLYDSHTRVA